LLGSVIDIAESITHAEFLSAAFAPLSLSSVLRATAASRQGRRETGGGGRSGNGSFFRLAADSQGLFQC
jgi:hypothetical protein